MRIYKYYRFLVGRKMEFKDLFASVDAFLKEQGLQYDSMGYYLEALGDRCQKLLQKMPQFAPMEVLEGPYSTSFRLTNLINDNDCDEISIRFVGSKIPRPYNFSNTLFYYRDIDFFGKKPTPCVAVQEEKHKYVYLFGSCIQLYRGFEGPNSTAVVMSIEIMDETSDRRADDYAAALALYLGNVKYITKPSVYLEPGEQAELIRWKAAALPHVKAAHDDLHERAEQVREYMLSQFPNVEYKQYNSRSILQRIGKKYGFDQVHSIPGWEAYFYKKVRGGIFLSVQMIRGSGMEMGLVLSGPGFSHGIADLSGHPENTAEANFFADQMFRVVEHFEKEYLDTILSIYPQYPHWYPFFEEK